MGTTAEVEVSLDFSQALGKHFKHCGRPSRDRLPLVVMTRERTWDRIGMAHMSADMGLKVGVEIGAAEGVSAKQWCDNNPLLHLTCVDPYIPYRGRRSVDRNERIYGKACENLSAYSNIVLLRETSLEVSRRFSNSSIDFLHIDGDHSFDSVMLDLVLWVPKVRKKGLIVIHDYFHFWGASVVEAIDVYTRCHHVDPWYITRCSHPVVFWERGAERAP